MSMLVVNIYVLTHGGKYDTTHTPLRLSLYEGYVSVRHNVTYRYYGNHRQGVKTLHPLLKVYGGSEIPKNSVTQLY